MVLHLMNRARVAKTIGGYLPKSLRWRSNPQKINATLWRQTKEKKEEPVWALLHLRNLVTNSSLMPLNCGCAVVPENNISSGCRTGRKRLLAEIFGVQLLEKEETNGINHVIGENVVLCSTSRDDQFKFNEIEYILYDISCHKNLKINPEGYLILHGPDRGIEIKDHISIRPCFDPYYERQVQCMLWSSNLVDCFLSHCVETRSGYLLANFAVYSDGLEARIYVTISDLELLMVPEIGTTLEVYGTVGTANSAVTHSQANSILFDCSSKDCAVLAHTPNHEAEIPLPLSRMVIVIPRHSDLIVDVNLFIHCDAQDISIANDSVVFDGAKRSNAITEEQTILGNHGKVKIKLSWMEGSDDVVSGAEEEVEEGLDEEHSMGDKFDAQKEGNEEWVVEKEGSEEAGSEFIFDDNCTKEWARLELDVEKGHGEADSEFMSDDDCSLGSFKLQDLKIEVDNSTRATDCTEKEILENEDGAQKTSWDIRPRWETSILEVFSIRIVCSENFNYDEIYGFIMIDACGPYHLLFRRVNGDPPQIDSQGYALLEGPRFFAWDVYGQVVIQPFLFKYQDFEFIDEKPVDEKLWCDHSEYDKVLCKTIGCDMGHIEVNFAVYKDAVQAHLEVTLTDYSFTSAEVYGTITATNSMLIDPRASSIIFKKEEFRANDVFIKPEKEVALPLSRPIIALPFGSTFKLVVDIHSPKKAINCTLFEFPVELTGVAEKTLPGNCCLVKVKVSFFHMQPEYVDQRYF